MLNFLRTTFTNTEKEDIEQEKYVHETQRFYGSKSTQFVNNYQNERAWKQNYILVNVIAEGYDIKRFLEAITKEKGKKIYVLILQSFPAKHRLFLTRRTEKCNSKVQRRLWKRKHWSWLSKKIFINMW